MFPRAIAFIFCLIVGMSIQSSQSEATTFKSGVYKDRDGVKIEFPSVYGNNLFGDIGKPISSHGILWMPKNVKNNQKVPLIVVMPGMGGQLGRDAKMCSSMTVAGIACFGTRPYPSRGIDQRLPAAVKLMQAGFASRLADAYGALEALADNPEIDIENAWLLGRSAGGSTAGLATVKEITAPFQRSDKDFKGFFAMYGPCLPAANGTHKNVVFKAFWSELDWVYHEKACAAMIENMITAGVNASSHFFKGKVGHGWDNVWYDKKRDGWRDHVPKTKTWPDRGGPNYGECDPQYDIAEGKIIYADNQEATSFSGVTGWEHAVEVCGVKTGIAGPVERASSYVEKNIISIILEQ